MKVSVENGHYVLTAETAIDLDFIGRVHFTPDRLHVLGFERGTRQNDGGWPVVGMLLSTAADSTTSERDAGVSLLRSLRNFQGLLSGQFAQNGAVSTDAANPQANEALATMGEDLQIVGEQGGIGIQQLEAVVEKVISTHVNKLLLNVRAGTLAQQGGAA